VRLAVGIEATKAGLRICSIRRPDGTADASAHHVPLECAFPARRASIQSHTDRTWLARVAGERGLEVTLSDNEHRQFECVSTFWVPLRAPAPHAAPAMETMTIASHFCFLAAARWLPMAKRRSSMNLCRDAGGLSLAATRSECDRPPLA